MKALKVVGGLLAMVVVALGGFAAFIHVDGIPHYPTQKVELKVESTPERVQRGKKWAAMLCSECHRNPQTGKLSGADMHLDDEFGNIHSYNITQHPTKGIGAWSDGELAFLLRTGIARDGRYTPPWMAKLPNMGDEDLQSIIAFLRSSEPEVQPADVDNVPSKPNFFSKFLSHVAFKPYAYPTKPIVAPAVTDTVAYGRYLTWNLDCWTCHSPDFSQVNPLAPETTPGYLSGGNQGIKGPDGKVVVSSNLTPDPETGLGKWTEEQFIRTVREGVRADGAPVRMAAYSLLTDEEIKAMWAYLKTVKPIVHAVPRSPFPAAPTNAGAGQSAYYKYGCVACHGTSGNGTCDLTQNKRHYATDEDLMAFIQDPTSKVPGSAMPRWRDVIPPAELRELISYVRTLDATKAQ